MESCNATRIDIESAMYTVGFVSTRFHATPIQYQGSIAQEEPLDIIYAMAASKPFAECVLIDLFSPEAPASIEAVDVIVFSTTNSYLQWNNHPLGISLFEACWRQVVDLTPAERKPIKIVFGPHVPVHWDQIYKLGADYVLIGEAELALGVLLRDLGESSRVKNSNTLGVVNRSTGPTSQRAIVSNLDDLPFPDYASTLGTRYNAHNDPKGRSHGHLYETSRGCPYYCSFCNTVSHRRQYRTKNPDKIVSELSMLRELSSADYVYFIDESFGFIDGWTYELCSKLIGIEFDLGCQGNLRFMSPKKFDAMSGAGFVSMEFGLESGSDIILQKVGKNNRLPEASSLICYAASVGISPLLFILVGLPGESRETLAKTVDFLSTLPPETRVSAAMPTPYVGTKFHALGVSSGKVPSDAIGGDLYQFTGRIGHDLAFDDNTAATFRSRYGPNFYLTESNLMNFSNDLYDLFQ